MYSKVVIYQILKGSLLKMFLHEMEIEILVYYLLYTLHCLKLSWVSFIETYFECFHQVFRTQKIEVK